MNKRVFAAIDIPEEARRKVSDYIQLLRARFPKARVNWDKPEKLHLTLKFFGEISDSQLTGLKTAASKAARNFSPFKIQISGTGVFPAPAKARVLWLGIIDTKGSLSELNKSLEEECRKLGFAEEKRDFKAHLTIARLKENFKELTETHLQHKFEAIEFNVNEIVVYQSELKPAGSIYLELSIHKFFEIS